tara:strand:+ start:1426 stop:1869 length:444 start_codon:yes stop_codon:yes gene_type:complete
MKTKKQKIFLFISIGVFIISLTQKSYCSSYGFCDNFGFLSVLIGWLGVFMLHIPAFTWLANPLLLGSWFFFKKKPKTSLILSIIAFILMLSFLLVDEIISNEAGTKSKVVFYGLGYWLWVLSSFMMILGNLLINEKILKYLKINASK